MRVRILEGLAQEMPIVTTSVGCEGIAVEHGRHLLIADDAAGFAAATLRLLTEPGLGATLGRNGRALVEERYDYRVGCRGVDEAYALARENRA
jgi:glycosyltransferase involved in cell wall biosynthesis